MGRKRNTKAKHGRRAFLRALPSAGAAFTWTADKLGGDLLGAFIPGSPPCVTQNTGCEAFFTDSAASKIG